MAGKKKQPKTFIYEARAAKGQTIAGEISADSIAIARTLLRKQNLTKIKLKIKRKALLSGRTMTALGPGDVALFSRQMATMQTAGIPLVQALAVIIEGSEKVGVAKIIRQIKDDVEGGSAFSEALRKQPKSFDELFCNLAESGEQAGKLDVMLSRIATYKEKTESLKRKIKKAMYYPAAVLVIAAVVTVILLVKVVPTFKDLFEGFGAELPAFTLFVLAISEALQEQGLKILIGFVTIGYLCIHAYKTKANFRFAIQRLTLKIPVFGKILRTAVISRFARTLSTTFAAGVPLPNALVSVAKASGNIVFFQAIMQIKDNVSAGQQMQAAMQRSGIFPNMVVQMVGIGEESGTLEEMLEKVANIYEEEVDAAVDGLTTLLEPMIMVILGVIVGGLVIAMYLPIFKLGSVI
jgi:type IV pilus assembly protein PilC